MHKLSIKALSFAITIGFIGVFCTYYLSVLVKNELKNQSYLKVENIAKQVSIRFQDALDISFNDLQALQAFYSANQHQSSQAEFNKYMQVLDIESRDYIHALSWVPLVTDSERENFEIMIKAQQADFNIKERNEEGKLIKSKSTSYYTPVTYISPHEKNKAAQGFDLSSNSTRSTSLGYARDSGNTTITAKIRLVQEEGSSYGFLIIAPVYKQNMKLTNQEERRQALLGYVTGVFRIDSLMVNAQEQAEKEGFLLTLVDLDKETGGVLYGQNSDETHFDYNLKIPDRYWQLRVSLTKTLKETINSPTIINWLLLGGIVISLLLAVTIYALKVSVIGSRRISSLSAQLQRQNVKLEEKVTERTELLALKNKELNGRIEELTEQRVIMSSLIKETEKAKVNAEHKAKELARSNKDLDDFAYVASHDLKAPLRGIMQLSSWIEEDIAEFANEDTKSNLQLLMSRTSRLEKLLEDLLDYSRIERKVGEIQVVDTKELILSVFDLQDPSGSLRLNCPESMPVINTSVSPFETIIRNLIGNAIKHINKKDGVITVSGEEFLTYYQFSVRDNGPGIPERYHEQIFELFKTLQPRDVVEGSGMGLSIIKKLLDYHNGSIVVESDGENGSCFTFTWPKIS
jgi:signal transduction histidine kinase